ncbi:hypothetical protein GCM10017687_24080 [Streptomyces echinatus]|uniref:hypothetical protein n=1 Tax=Streptomyces echinatus TaxID=67293 RepID=UPI0031E9D4A3
MRAAPVSGPALREPFAGEEVEDGEDDEDGDGQQRRDEHAEEPGGAVGEGSGPGAQPPVPYVGVLDVRFQHLGPAGELVVEDHPAQAHRGGQSGVEGDGDPRVGS